MNVERAQGPQSDKLLLPYLLSSCAGVRVVLVASVPLLVLVPEQVLAFHSRLLQVMPDRARGTYAAVGAAAAQRRAQRKAAHHEQDHSYHHNDPDTTWLGTLVPMLLAIITVVGVLPWVIYTIKSQADKNQAMFQAVVSALRCSNERLDAEWRAKTEAEGRQRKRWQWWVGRHIDGKHLSSRPRLVLLPIAA